MTSSLTRCPECDSELVAEGSEQVCSSCALVVEGDRIDHGPEWRMIDEDASKQRRVGDGISATRADNGLGSKIGWMDADPEPRKRNRLRHLNNRQSTTAWNRDHGYESIQRMATALGISSYAEQACTVFKQAQEAGLLSGRTIEGMAGASVYATARLAGVSRTLEEIEAVCADDRDGIVTAYDAMNRELDIPIPAPHPADFMARLADDVGIPTRYEQTAGALAERAVESGCVDGHTPKGVAAACLYMALGGEAAGVSQSELAASAGVAPKTVRRAWKRIDATVDSPPKP